ncbi:type II toxin-antitoxin system RelE/ParE family toxin [Testudinibacter aquarius]|nr:type II toxin-antitoxin system RelE/ParE family toxin [Testudinibacter aquarius]
MFDEWYLAQEEELRRAVLASMALLEMYGPQLGRPYADTVKASVFNNMKELRIQHKGNPVRAFFAFDPIQQAIVFCAGDKTGLNEQKFYKKMLKIADMEFQRHLDNLKRK